MTIFRPNLFKIFTNDLPKYLQETPDFVSLNGRRVHCLMFADDVILLSKTAAGLQSKIDILNHYCEDWCLNVNTNKTKILVFNKAGRHYRLNFKFNNVPLESVNEYKYLGMHFCASGSFSYAQEQLYKKG